MDELSTSQQHNASQSILVIAMANSVHTARWLSQFESQDIEFVLFPSTATRNLHPSITTLVNKNGGPLVTVPYALTFLAFPLTVLDLFFRNFFRSSLINCLLRSRKDIRVIHAIELQHAGYLTLRIRQSQRKDRHLILTNWGSDIFWFQKFKGHRKKITQLLSLANSYSCECERDVSLAKELGFTGIVHKVLPNAGGISDEVLVDDFQTVPPAVRRNILIKGYTRFVGLADVALEACATISDELSNINIIIYSADSKTKKLAKVLSMKSGLDITVYGKYELSHSEMLNLFASARAYVGISQSDGISTSLLEAMATGCFPIQSSTSCADEWIEHGLSGLIVDCEKVEEISAAISLALRDDELVMNAARTNRETARARLKSSDISRFNLDFYAQFS